MPTRRQVLTQFAAGAAASLRPARAASPPNVVLVLTDDQGYGDLHCHGNSVIRTPNLDRLHSQSVCFTNFHVDPLCSPTRSALMTGRYACRTGVWATVMGRNLLRRDEVTMADVFAANGYRTGLFGKWHLGDNYPYRPQDRGFQDILSFGGGGVGQTPDYWGNRYFDDTYWHNGRFEKFRGYCTDVFFDGAIRFLEENRTRPFFLYLPTNAPHAPYLVADKYADPYRKQGLPDQLARFYGMITNIDDNMARLRASMQKLGLEDNTILIWMTDNGTAAGDTGVAGPVGYGGFNAGMRGTKGSAYDGGHRTPCFVRWPAGGIQGPREIGTLAAHIDLLPTVVELARIESLTPELDGTSLAPLLKGGRAPADRTLFVQVQQRQEKGRWKMDHPEPWIGSAVMTDRWRLVEGRELFDMTADPAQMHDVSAVHAEEVKRLRAAYETWYAGASKRFSEYNHILIGDDHENPTRLNCMDWHGDVIPWNQDMIRQAPEANGFWAVEIARAGRYEFTLRQQPLEANFPIEAAEARLTIQNVDQSKPVPNGAQGVTFQLELAAGKTRLQTYFKGPKGTRGAFYVYIHRH
jgi:arylsulfatase A-like enzyme